MRDWFVFDNSVEPFQLFSMSHVIAIAVIVLINLAIYWRRKSLAAPHVNRIMRYGLAVALIAQEVSLHIWSIYDGSWSIATRLPLHLCGVSIIACSIMLCKTSYSLYEVAYFWGMGGAVQAVLTPDLGAYGFPHYRFYQFFVSHGLIITAVLFMTVVHSFRPTIQSIVKTFKVTNILLVFVALVNYATGGNYFYIAHKPATPSLLDYLGPWPWYILSLEVVGLIVFTLCYLPFAWIKPKTEVEEQTNLRFSA